VFLSIRLQSLVNFCRTLQGVPDWRILHVTEDIKELPINVQGSAHRNSRGENIIAVVLTTQNVLDQTAGSVFFSNALILGILKAACNLPKLWTVSCI
jgi:hypothetical protein